jgi:hypothetical protein
MGGLMWPAPANQGKMIITRTVLRNGSMEIVNTISSTGSTPTTMYCTPNYYNKE